MQKEIDIKNKLESGLTFKISPFREVIKKTRPHRHEEYYEMIFLSQGEGFHCIESDKFMISAPEFYFLKPGQLHFWQFTSIPKGYVILLKESEFNALQESSLLGLFRNLSDITRIELANGYYPEFLLSEIQNEFQVATQYSREIIHGLLKALMGKLLYTADQSMERKDLVPSVYDRFRQLLTAQCPELHKVNDFAALLNTTAQNLNTICRRSVNQSAGRIITQQIILEAKRYILHTDSTISEIAGMLSFSDASNFIKFFRKHEGITPAHFRDQYFH